MSSYSEFKSDVKSIAAGILIFMILGALIQLAAVVVILLLSLFLIPIARLFTDNEGKIQALKTGIFYGVGLGIIVSFFILAFSALSSASTFQSVKMSEQQVQSNHNRRVQEYGAEWNAEYEKWNNGTQPK